MNKTPKKSTKKDWIYLSIIFGIILIALILLSVNWNKTEDYQNVKPINSFIDSQNQEQDSYDQEYEEADAIWAQHRNILIEDSEKTRKAFLNCDGAITGVPACANALTPILNAYSIHVINAQNFMKEEGDVFENQQELLAYLDSHAVYINNKE